MTFLGDGKLIYLYFLVLILTFENYFETSFLIKILMILIGNSLFLNVKIFNS
jgi:hypothetical protein